MESLSTTLKTAGSHLILEILFLFLFLIFILMITESFFIAGAVGMAKTVIETGRTSLSDMLHYGGEKILDLFIARFILSIFTFVLTIVFIGISVLITSLILHMVGVSILRFADSLLGIILLIVSLLFITLPFTIVISNIGPINALKASYKFSMDNKLPVVILFVFIEYLGKFSIYFVMLVTAIVFSAGVVALPSFIDIPNMTSYSLSQFLTNLLIMIIITILIFILISGILNIFLFMPLSTLWWSLLYVDRTKTDLWKNDKVY